MQRLLTLLILAATALSCEDPTPPQIVFQYEPLEIVLKSTTEYANPYTDVFVSAVFYSEHGDTLHRPGFWDGDKRWKIRFASPIANTRWSYRTESSNLADAGLHNKIGDIVSLGADETNGPLSHGPLRMSPGKRNLIHHDGTPFLLVGDTPWALPFRATYGEVDIYAGKRAGQGFNAALLMTVQPDTKAEGPDARATDQGFARGFDDLSDGHINRLRPEYFAYLDSTTNILLNNGIVPVYQPVFHGFGWKGLEVLGTRVEPEEYVRYCRYLLARYGARPAIWLIAADHDGEDPGVREAGEMLQREDVYRQPVGIHYNPCDDYIADWAIDDPDKRCMHLNKTFQDADWLDFQWAQTGHGTEHQYHKVRRMYDNRPIKAVANGEPTYEGMNGGKNGLGWWQGEDAWGQLFSGGTMGVVYGAAGLWQWKVSAAEAGWTDWASQPESWRSALDLPGAEYVGFVGKALRGVNLTDIERRPPPEGSKYPLLVKPGKAYLAWLPEGGAVTIMGVPKSLSARWFNAKLGEFTPAVGENGRYVCPGEGAWVLVVK